MAEERVCFSRITYVIGPHSTITTKEGRERRAFPPSSPPLCTAHGSGRARHSELLRRRPWEGCTHTQESKLQLPSRLPRLLMDMFSPSKRWERERCARRQAACSQPFLTISAETEDEGRALCCHVRHCGCITCGGGVNCCEIS